jgi:hypothetical protein
MMPAIFISRLVPGGLAESTGLLAVNDEVLEVNGIDVAGKTLDQVTDMMVANSSNPSSSSSSCSAIMSLSNDLVEDCWELWDMLDIWEFRPTPPR